MGSSASEKMEIRYASYIEEKHHDFLWLAAYHRDQTINSSPFSGYSDLSINDAFFGAGYTISSFPSLYDMYGKFMAGLDVDALYSQLFEDTVNSPEVNNLVSAEASLMEDDIEVNSLPRLQVGLRDANSVIASSFVIGKALIEETRVKALEKFRAELKYNLIPVVRDRWVAHLDWNKNIVCTYAEIIKFYISTDIDVNEVNYGFKARNKLWPFTVLEYNRAALGALQGATTTTANAAGSSTTARVLSGALSGAATGAMIGGSIAPATTANAATGTAASSGGAGWGAGIGAALGIAAALTY